jgi:hypothetical protein
MQNDLVAITGRRSNCTMSSHCKRRRRWAGADVVVVVLMLVLVVGTPAAVAAPFRADYPIDSIAQDEGTRFTGSAENERVGQSVAGSGDVDGDGVADFVMGARYANSLGGGALGADRAYVVYGVANTSDAAATWPKDTTILAIAQDSNRGRIIDGGAGSTQLEGVVAIVGDVNGDRFDDIAVSSSSWSGWRKV